MNRREELRRTLRLAAQSISRTISTVREQGHDELAAELSEVFAQWCKAGDRGVRRVAPRGRAVVPPIVVEAAPRAREFGPHRPPVGVEEYRRYLAQLREQYAVRTPALRVVPLRPLAKAGRDGEVLDAG